jgi:hypothetical protein
MLYVEQDHLDVGQQLDEVYVAFYHLLQPQIILAIQM